MNTLETKILEAIENKNNDVNTFVWKLARKSDGTQEEIKLMDASPEQLQKFYDHCFSMLYNVDKINPGRYTLLNIIKEQREKCNVEIYLRKLQDGSITKGISYPRHLYWLDLQRSIEQNKEHFPQNKLNEITIASLTGGLPLEFSRLSIADVRDGCLDALGTFNAKHLTFSFILNLGVYLTPEEMKEFNIKDENGKTRSKLEVIKERLNIKPSVHLTVKPSGLNFTELRAMLNLRSKKYSELTTDQLITLRNKVLFRLEQEVNYHINQWENRINQILKVCDVRNITLDTHNK